MFQRTRCLTVDTMSALPSRIGYLCRTPLAFSQVRAHRFLPCHLVDRRRRTARFPERLSTRAVGDPDDGPQLEKLDSSSAGGLGGTSEDVFGPLAILLIGFQENEYHRMGELLKEMDASMIELIPCPPKALTATLEELITMTDVPYRSSPLGLRRLVFLSGMYASEVQEVISAYRDAGLPETVFAAYVPKNKDKRMVDIVDEVYGDHEYMIGKQNRERQNKNH